MDVEKKEDASGGVCASGVYRGAYDGEQEGGQAGCEACQDRDRGRMAAKERPAKERGAVSTQGRWVVLQRGVVGRGRRAQGTWGWRGRRSVVVFRGRWGRGGAHLLDEGKLAVLLHELTLDAGQHVRLAGGHLRVDRLGDKAGLGQLLLKHLRGESGGRGGTPRPPVAPRSGADCA